MILKRNEVRIQSANQGATTVVHDMRNIKTMCLVQIFRLERARAEHHDRMYSYMGTHDMGL